MGDAEIDPELCRQMAGRMRDMWMPAVADQLTAAAELAERTVARDAEFIALRKALHARLVQVQRLHPVVVAADVWRDDPCKGLGSHREADLVAAVDYYRSLSPPVILAEITSTDADIIERALGVYSSDYNEAPHEDIARIRAALKGGSLATSFDRAAVAITGRPAAELTARLNDNLKAHPDRAFDDSDVRRVDINLGDDARKDEP